MDFNVGSQGEALGINKVSIDIAYITHMFEFLEGEWGDGKTLVDYNTQIFTPTKWYQYPINKKATSGIIGVMWCSMFSFFVFQTSFTNTYDPYHIYVL